MNAPGDVDGPDGAALGDAVLAREPGALARAAALATSADPARRASARAAVDSWARRTGKSLRVGLTGSAAAAVDALARRLAERGHRVAVLRVAGPGGDAAPGEAGRTAGAATGAATADGFAAILPADGTGAADAVRACEIGGYDTVLVATDDPHGTAIGSVVDCLVGNSATAQVGFDPGTARDDAALDGSWADVRRWHWDAVENGDFAEGRRTQQRARDASS